MRILMTVGLYFFSLISIGQNIYSPQKEYVTLGAPLEDVLRTFKAKKEKNGFYYNRQEGYAFGLDKSNQLQWFSTDKAGVQIGDGSIKHGMFVKDIKMILTKQQIKNVKLFGTKFLFISGLNNFPDTEFIVFLENEALVKTLRDASETPYRTDNGIYNVPIDLIPNDLKINSIRVTQTKM